MSTFYVNNQVDIDKRLEKRFKDREDEYITYKQFYVLVGTFNVNNRQAPTSHLLDEWLYRQIDGQNPDKKNVFPDIVAVGFQEIDTSSGAYIYDDRKKEDEWEHLVRKTLSSCYKSKDEDDKFQLLDRVKLMGILLFVYVRSVHMSKCTLVFHSSVPTGFMGIAGNKGGVGISLRFYETQICFVNCHFAAGDGQTSRRNFDYQMIESRMTFNDGGGYSFKDYLWYGTTMGGTIGTNTVSPSSPTRSPSWKINDHDIIFWFGDMNYRIAHANEQVRKAISELSTIPLQEKDQLRREMKLNNVFNNYSEANIDFMPTYKFDPRTDNYDTSEKLRTPSWTDRILYHAKRSKVHPENGSELETIQALNYTSAKTIRFSDHRPVSGLYYVVIKYDRNAQQSYRIREELIRQLDREENDSIPTIELQPSVPAIVFDNLRYLDSMTYSLSIRNVGEFSCVYSIVPSSRYCSMNQNKTKQMGEEPFFDCLTLTPNPPYTLEPNVTQTVHISFQMKSQYAWLFGSRLSEILILHVENGADTFITLDITLDMGPFGLAFNQFPPTLYDKETKQYVYSLEPTEQYVEMKNDPPALYIALIECLKSRQDINILYIFNNDTQDTIDLLPIRDQIYKHDYNFEQFSSAQIFMILLHLLQSLPEALISREIQDRIFLSSHSARSSNIPVGGVMQSHIPSDNRSASLSLSSLSHSDMAKAVSVIIEQLKPKERNLFFRFLLLLQKSWPSGEQIRKLDQDQRNTLNVSIDVLAVSLLHDHTDREHRHAFLVACLNEDKKKSSK